MRKILLSLVFLCAIGNGFAQGTYNNPDTGTKVLGSYVATDVDSVNLSNGNLHVSIPFFELPGRELPLHLAMVYDSSAYELRAGYTWPDTSVYTAYDYHAWRKDAGVSGALHASNSRHGSIYNSNNGHDGQCCGPFWQDWDLTITWVKPDGTLQRFTKLVTWNCGNQMQCPDPGGVLYDNLTFELNQSEFVKLTTGNNFSGQGNPPAPAFIYLKNGNKLDVSNRGIITANGNVLKADDSNTQTWPFHGEELHDYLTLSDTVGRQITYSSSNDTYAVTLHDANGQTKTYTISWAVINLLPQYFSNDDQRVRVVQNIQLPNGRSFHFDYNSNGYLEKLTLPSGGYIKYVYCCETWNSATNTPYYKVSQRKVSEDGTTGGERIWSYTYDSQNAVTTVTDPTGAKHQENSGGMSQWTKDLSSSNVVLRQTERTWGTGDNPRVLSVRTTVGRRFNEVHYEYDSNNNVTLEENYDWSDMPNLGTKIRKITRGYLTSTDYTNRHILNRLSSETVYTGSGAAAAKTEYLYDEFSPLTSRSGTIPGWTDPGTTFRGNVTTVKRYKDATNSVSEKVKYDVLGNVVEKIDPLTRSTLIGYDDTFCRLVSGSCTNTDSHNSFAFPTQVTNPLSQSVTTKYDFETGLPTVAIDLRGSQTKTTYDAMNRVTKITEPNGKETTYSYDDTNRVTTKEVTVDSSGNKGHVETTFDGLYRAKQTRTNDPGGTIVVDTVYDALGRAVKVSNPYRQSGSAPAWTYTAWDALGRTICTSVSTATTNPCDSGGPVDAKVLYSYTPDQTTTTNEAGNQRRYTYNVLGKMMKVEEPNPSLDTPLVTTYTYETIGPLKQTNQSGQTRTLTHDWLGRETQEQLPESGTTTYTYDDAGHMLTATDARGVVTTYQYDYLGRATQRSYSDGTPTVKFTYDQNGYTGLRTKMEDALGVVTYAYDNMNRLTSEGRTIVTSGVTDGTFTTSYSYNVKGDLKQMTYPSGRVVDFNYATGGGCCNSRLGSVVATVGSTSTTLANAITFDAAGAITARTLNPDGSVPLSETFAYNYRMQQTQVRVAEGSTDVMNFTYGYGTTNNVGQLLSRSDAIQPEHSATYVYDSIYRLAQVAGGNGSWAIDWTFDVWSNRLTQTPQGYVYGHDVAPGTTVYPIGTQTLGYTNNRLSSQTYDAAGNVTNDGSHNYTFNGKNQITSMDGGIATYMYDGEGRRVKKTVSSVSTFYFYGPGGIISEFSTSSGASAASSSDVTRYQTSDRQGTAVLLIASSGLVLENNRTLPYGELWCPPTSAPSSTTKKFTTYERDSESNLDYAINRYLASSYGRFVSSDKGPIISQLPASLNRYGYVYANPVNNVDPDGNFSPIPQTGTSQPPISNQDPGCLQDGRPALDPRCGEDPGGGGETPEPARPECDRSNAKNESYLNFIDAHAADSAKLASQLGVTVADILAVSAEESAFGDTTKSALAGNGNFFGLHNKGDGTLFPGQIGTYTTKPKTGRGVDTPIFSAATGFMVSGMVFVNREKQFLLGVKNAADPTTFASIIHQHGYGVGNPNYVKNTVSIIGDFQKRLDCPKQ